MPYNNFMAQQSLLDKFTENKDGKFTLFQAPNLPIILWAIFKAFSYLPVSSNNKSGLEFISTSFLFVWAYLELTSGVNYSRRILGAVVLFVLIVTRF